MGKKRKLVIYHEFNRTKKRFLTNHCTSLYTLVEKFAGKPPQLVRTRRGCGEGPGRPQGVAGGSRPRPVGTQGAAGFPRELGESFMGLPSLKSHWKSRDGKARLGEGCTLQGDEGRKETGFQTLCSVLGKEAELIYWERLSWFSSIL